MRLSLRATHEQDVLTFPMRGRDGTVRDYTIQPCSIDEWEQVSSLGASTAQVMAGRKKLGDLQQEVNGLSEEQVWGMVLGPDTFAAMRADGVDIVECRRAFGATVLWYSSGMDPEVAEAAWSGKAPQTPTASPSTGGASSTRRPASTSGTTSRRTSASSSAGRPKAKSPGRKSGHAAT